MTSFGLLQRPVEMKRMGSSAPGLCQAMAKDPDSTEQVLVDKMMQDYADGREIGL